jgi:F0F1-type ATP synthase alpha subunit
MEEQATVIYAGVNGYLDPIAVDRVRAFEDGLLSLMRSKHADILEDIRKTGDLTDATGRQAESGGRRLREELCLNIIVMAGHSPSKTGVNALTARPSTT